MLLQILQITAPVFLLTLAGYVWARRKLPFDLEFITRLSVSFSIPCLIFAVLVKVEIDPAASGKSRWPVSFPTAPLACYCGSASGWRG